MHYPRIYQAALIASFTLSTGCGGQPSINDTAESIPTKPATEPTKPATEPAKDIPAPTEPKP